MIGRFFTAVSCFVLAGIAVLLWGRTRPGYGWHDFILGRPLLAAVQLKLTDVVPMQEADVSTLEKADQEATKLVETVKPAVVSIDIKTVTTSKYLVPDLFGWRQQFRRFTDTGSGAGVFISEDGYVITNEHVIRKADEISVTLHDQTKMIATLVGADPVADIAILKVQSNKPTKFTALPLADSDKVKVGQQVWAIGNPFGLSETVTYGHISHRARQLGDGELPKFQHDAVIEPGSSGGPLINTRGEIVGINNMIYNAQENGKAAWQGISFAIPANVVRRSMDRLLNSDGKAASGYLGLLMDTSIDRAARTSKAVVIEVAPGSPAEKAGIKAGDVLVKFAGKNIIDSTTAFEMIAEWPIGEPVDLKVLRDDQEIAIKATVIDRAKALTPDEQESEQKELREQVGIAVRDLTQVHRARLSLQESDPGIYVAEIEKGSPAEGSFFRGDLIIDVNEQQINNVQEFYDAMSRARATRDRRAVVRVFRQNRLIPLTITLPE